MTNGQRRQTAAYIGSNAMTKYRITEIQRVYAVREVEADTPEAAYNAFCHGEGRKLGADGKVTSSDLVSIEIVAA
jgi:hypothetical protein